MEGDTAGLRKESTAQRGWAAEKEKREAGEVAARTAGSCSRAGDVFSVLRARHVSEAPLPRCGESWRGRLESRQGRGSLGVAPPRVVVEGPMGVGKRRDSRDTRWMVGCINNEGMIGTKPPTEEERRLAFSRNRLCTWSRERPGCLGTEAGWPPLPHDNGQFKHHSLGTTPSPISERHRRLPPSSGYRWVGPREAE